MSAGMVTCRRATTADHAAVAELFYRCDLHYWGDKAPTAEDMAAHVREHVLAETAKVEILLAEMDGKTVGFASFAVLYPAPDLGGALFLKDLFTLEAARGKGIGLTLMRELARIAVARGCVRFDWTAEDHNPRATDFYDRIGARRVTEKVYYRFDGTALRDFAGED
ncbi:GNAT family N-acetyltransferase [Pelagibius litoralis]|uniref:GNAT family N-acetyltransferase n=1 Tax=Pelagibius litoralis TaxID=374515 RepID=A0A967EUU7_9PROT|nr:GNAT family N-acetyltransferase [Pelagibius litoralis]NIA67562.1 GNAT family N-acetyltransferase [Pelagibius litoralis]